MMWKLIYRTPNYSVMQRGKWVQILRKTGDKSYPTELLNLPVATLRRILCKAK